MASQYIRLLDATAVGGGKESAVDKIVDLGAFTRIECHCRSLKNGTAGTIQLYHAAVNEPDAWVAIAVATWNLDGTGTRFIEVTAFLRYIKWVTDGAVAGGPVTLIDLIAKG